MPVESNTNTEKSMYEAGFKPTTPVLEEQK
jgi:hypothetical protein